jgi:integrase
VKGNRVSRAPIRRLKTGRKRWMLDLRYLGGKREFYETEDEAKAVRDVKLAEVRKHGSSALSLSHADRVEFCLAKDRLVKLGLTIREAVDFVEEHHQVIKPLPIREALELLVAEKEAAGVRERTIKNLRGTVFSFERSVAGKLVSEVSHDDVVNWLGGNGWAPATVRTKRIDLQTFFRAAVARKWATHDPTKSLEREHLDEQAPGILTVEQCRSLLEGCRKVQPIFCGFISLALFAGIRPEELERMDQSDIDLVRGYAEVRADVAKTRQRRLVELSKNCKAWIKVGLELPPLNSRGRMNKARLMAGFEGFRKQVQGGKEQWVKVPGEAWPHDAMRHSFASYHLALHGSAEQTSLQMGHRSSDMLFRHYRELVTKQEAEKFWRISP